ncbi:hypothetical protein [Streptomyces virginiae]|uniref:hypothetical protein n=2 Tax=Streptomyces virginiae TaxID=1961 RepID=UPI000A999F07|nr:hypothetical protein [Streptomyces virginiae]MCX4716679.1 hypothetical protein [Streptomyces virginiae]MCX5274431.1 hypothetical protein [Streptomyces virginiae]
MRKLAWAARGMSVVSGAVLLGALMVPSAVADDGPWNTADPSSSMAESKRCGARDVSSAAPDYSNFPDGVIFRVASDAQGHAFLNDSRNSGVWINLGVLANAPKCVIGTATSVTENNPGLLYITLLTQDGAQHQAVCTSDDTPFAPSTIVTACGAGFTLLPNTPVMR